MYVSYTMYLVQTCCIATHIHSRHCQKCVGSVTRSDFNTHYIVCVWASDVIYNVYGVGETCCRLLSRVGVESSP